MVFQRIRPPNPVGIVIKWSQTISFRIARHARARSPKPRSARIGDLMFRKVLFTGFAVATLALAQGGGMGGSGGGMGGSGGGMGPSGGREENGMAPGGGGGMRAQKPTKADQM